MTQLTSSSFGAGSPLSADVTTFTPSSNLPAGKAYAPVAAAADPSTYEANTGVIQQIHESNSNLQEMAAYPQHWQPHGAWPR